MVTKDSIFLTLAETKSAICNDFRQYPPQLILFGAILPLITGGRSSLTREPGKEGGWISRIGQRNLLWMEGTELVDYMCEAVAAADPDPDLLADVSGRVFQTRAFPDRDPTCNQLGIRVETGMEAYTCLQCGQCCRSLEYRNDLSEDDVGLWKRLGRTDILEWVGTTRKDGHIAGYRMWVSPKTGRMVDTCPFLTGSAKKRHWKCSIQKVKPTICRQYPLSRKHAVMTGCKGFKPPSKDP